MPIYAYRCEACGFAKDVLQKVSDPQLTVCLSCGEPTFKKQLTAAGFQLKGTGWYATDFRNGSGTAAPAVAGNAAEASSEAKPGAEKAGSEKSAGADKAGATGGSAGGGSNSSSGSGSGSNDKGSGEKAGSSTASIPKPAAPAAGTGSAG